MAYTPTPPEGYAILTDGSRLSSHAKFLVWIYDGKWIWAPAEVWYSIGGPRRNRRSVGVVWFLDMEPRNRKYAKISVDRIAVPVDQFRRSEWASW